MSYWWMIRYSRPTVVLNRSTHSWLPVNGCRAKQAHSQLPLKSKVQAQFLIHQISHTPLTVARGKLDGQPHRQLPLKSQVQARFPIQSDWTSVARGKLVLLLFQTGKGEQPLLLALASANLVRDRGSENA